MMTRTYARRLAVQLSFAVSSGSDIGPDSFFDEEYFRALPAEGELFSAMPDERERAYISTLVNGVREHQDELDEIVSRYAHGWKLSRISKTALAVLRVALFEILYMPDIPDAASINEAVELAKTYDEPETVRFINGILGSFMRERNESECVSEAAEETAENS
jgi:transcription antitermination protein NusB